MRRNVLFALFIATAAFGQQHPMTFEDMLSLHRVGAPQLSPDGKWIAYDASTPDLKANKSTSAVYLVPAGGGASKSLTDGSGPAWSPDGRTIAFVKDSQAYLYDVAAGTSRKVSDLPGGAGSIKWTPDGSALVVVSDIHPDCGVDPACIKDKTSSEEARPSKARVIDSLLYRHWRSWTPATRAHIVYVPLGGGGARDLTPGAFDAPPFSIGGGDEFDVSPDGREMVYARDVSAHPELSTNSDLYLVSVAAAASAAGRAPEAGAPTQAKRITTRGGADTSPRFSPDGKWIAWRSQARGGYESDLFELWLYDRANGKTRRLAPQFDNWIESFAWASDSKTIYFTAPEKSNVAIYEVAVEGGEPLRLYAKGSADALAVGRDGKIYFDQSTLDHPTEIWVMHQIAGGWRGDKVTHDNDTVLAGLTMGETQDLWYTGAEGAKVQALLVKPPNFDPSKKYPAVVLIHGGPQGAWNDGWSYRWNPQMYAARGYVVLMPNPRGSTGYGQKFVEEISGDWGGKAYVDIMNGVDQLAAMPFVDGARIGAAGASYGGYMVDWILGHTDRFKALVTHAGVYNLESMYGVTEELWFPEWEFHGNPWDNPELYAKWSPNKFVKSFKTPTLVSHGELDFRVPVGEGLQLFTALQRRGIPSRLLYFPDEGHWVLKPQNSKMFYSTVLDWLDRWLK
jgi:dipeptidyl aminopeptidase/acylaminoacyl peptidase